MNHVARSRARPEFIAQHEAATALIEIYQSQRASVPEGERAEIDRKIEDLRGFVANLLSDKETDRQVWVPIGLFDTENSTTGRDRGAFFVLQNTSSNTAYGEREFLFRGANMTQIREAFSRGPGGGTPEGSRGDGSPRRSSPRLSHGSSQLPSDNSETIVVGPQMAPGTVSEVGPDEGGRMAVLAGRNRGRRAEAGGNQGLLSPEDAYRRPSRSQTRSPDVSDNEGSQPEGSGAADRAQSLRGPPAFPVPQASEEAYSTVSHCTQLNKNSVLAAWSCNQDRVPMKPVARNCHCSQEQEL